MFALLRSLYVLPTSARTDCYFKVVLPSVAYALVVWGSCRKCLFNELERIHLRVAKIIYGLDWCTPSDESWSVATGSQLNVYVNLGYFHWLISTSMISHLKL